MALTRRLMCSIFALFATSAMVSAAPTASEFRISESMNAADLVFHGTVVNVDYRDAKDGTPHAFVTYKIKQIIKGKLARDQASQKQKAQREEVSQVTLRFIGGPHGDGRFLTASVVPNFAPGDEDILFVAKNGTSMCPLVVCPHGRFRILDGGVYQGFATPVVGAFDDRITTKGPDHPKLIAQRFPAPSFEELYKQPQIKEFYEKLDPAIPYEELKKAYETHAPSQVIMRPRAADLADAEAGKRPEIEPVGVDAFLEVLATAAAKVKKEPPLFHSVDPGEAFETGLTKPAAPPEPSKGNQRLRLPFSTQQLERFQEDDFNPVVK